MTLSKIVMNQLVNQTEVAKYLYQSHSKPLNLFHLLWQLDISNIEKIILAQNKSEFLTLYKYKINISSG